MDWEEKLWAELEDQTEPDRILMASSMITHIVRDLLPQLADVRRTTAASLVQSGNYTPTTLAENIGARPTTVKRLVEEGRRLLRQADAA